MLIGDYLLSNIIICILFVILLQDCGHAKLLILHERGVFPMEQIVKSLESC